MTSILLGRCGIFSPFLKSGGEEIQRFLHLENVKMAAKKRKVAKKTTSKKSSAKRTKASKSKTAKRKK